MKTIVKHIVLADDDEEDVEIFQIALEEACPDIELNVADDGDTLLALLERITIPDLIVLDINMPRKSGKLCLHEIRSNPLYNTVPIIILTTSNNVLDIEYCLANGANRFFTKPPSISEVIKIIEQICGLTGS